jgi:hypothetical protein
VAERIDETEAGHEQGLRFGPELLAEDPNEERKRLDLRAAG